MNIKPVGNRTVQDFANADSDMKLKRDRSLRHNIEYGKILEVDLESMRVRVERQDGTELKGPTINGSSSSLFFPLITPITTIHMLYGSLRPGLSVRIHWIGEGEPDNLVAIDVVSNDNLVFQDFGSVNIERGFNSSKLNK